MRRKLLEHLQTGYLLADGGMGTELLHRGLPVGASTAAWNLQQPDHVSAVHRAFVDAGADCLLTNTFTASRLHLEEQGLQASLEEINRTALELARAVAGEERYVLGSIGPCSTKSSPGEGLDSQQAADIYSEQVTALAAGDALDALLIETVTDSRELRAAVQAARQGAPGLPLFVSLCLRKLSAGQGIQLMRSGESLDDAIQILAELQLDGVGVNCGDRMEPSDYNTAAAALRARFEGPVLVRPNAGTPTACGADVSCTESPEMVADALWGWVRAGANLVGGCCGITPEHIRLMREELDKL